MNSKNLIVTTKIMNLDDIKVSSRILLYYFVTVFNISKDNNIPIDYKIIYEVLALSEENIEDIIMELKMKNYIKVQKEPSKLITLTPKTLIIIK